MNNEPLVSVIVNCYNGSSYLKTCLDSIMNQSYSNFEVIFWDNASTDDSVQIAESYPDKVKIFKSESNVPLYHARNFALDVCSGELIAFLDCDDFWYPEKLSLQVPFFQNENVGLVYCDSIEWIDGIIDGDVINNKGTFDGNCTNVLIENYFLGIETVVIKREFILKNNLRFNQKLNYVGDAEFFIKISNFCEIRCMPKVLAKWRLHSESLSIMNPDMFYFENLILAEELKRFFDQRYSKEIECFERNNKLKFIFRKWKQGKNKELRDFIISNSLINFKFLIFYILSFAPYGLLRYVFYILTLNNRFLK